MLMYKLAYITFYVPFSCQTTIPMKQSLVSRDTHEKKNGLFQHNIEKLFSVFSQ